MEIAYYKQLTANPHFTLRNFASLIKRSVDDRTPYRYTEPIELGDTLYNVSFDPSRMRLLISFEDERGNKVERAIQVVQERSNLPNSGAYVYYFLCPRLGVKCRTIYRVGSYFWSRGTIKALYPLQMMSSHTRQISCRDEPYRQGGKRYYRGKLTPYGKRCNKYEEYSQRQISVMWNWLQRHRG